MPNLMITNYCNLACPYCFGIEQMSPNCSPQFMTRDTYLDLLGWMKTSELDYFHLMGGEPTLHEDFLWMLEKASEKGFKVDVFSNGITDFSDDEIKMIKEKSRFWIVNVNDPKNYSADKVARLEKLLKGLNDSASITFNITDEDYDPSYVIDYINNFKLRRDIKLGIALPTLNQENKFASTEDFAGLSRTVVELSYRMKKEKIMGEFECGVPHCFFNNRQRTIIKKNNFASFSQCCSMLDILPDGNAIYCLPLAKLLKEHYSRFKTYLELWTYFQDYYRPYRSAGYKKECLTCKWKWSCNGSCLSRIMPYYIGAGDEAKL